MSFKNIDPLINFDEGDVRYLGEFMRTKADRFITEKDVKECANEAVCVFMGRFLKNTYDPELTLTVADLIFNKFNDPTLKFEVIIKYGRTLDDIKNIRDRVKKTLEEELKVINDYGYKEE